MDLYIFKLINQFALKWSWLDILAVFFAEYFEYVLVFCLFLFSSGWSASAGPTMYRPFALPPWRGLWEVSWA